VHEIAKSSSVAFSILVLSTTGFPKVCDRGKLRIQRTAYLRSVGMISESGRPGDGKVHTCVPAVIQVINGSLCLRFPFISRIYVANEVVSNVVAHLGRMSLGRWKGWKGLACNSSKCPNLANSQYKSSYTASKPSCNSCSDNLQTGS
jgi:hypothetical protein